MLLDEWILVFQKIILVLKCLSLKLKDIDRLKLCELLGQQHSIVSDKTCVLKFSLLYSTQCSGAQELICYAFCRRYRTVSANY